MQIQYAETVVPVKLDKVRNLVFNANCMMAYEEATGKFFLTTVASLYDAMRPALAAQAKAAEAKEGEDAVIVSVNPLSIIQQVPMKELRALIWAALHEYGKNPADPDEPSWPLTINQVGRLIQIQDVPRIFTAFLKGQTRNSPTQEELGESRQRSVQAPATAPASGGNVPRTEAASGGERSIELPVDAFI